MLRAAGMAAVLASTLIASGCGAGSGDQEVYLQPRAPKTEVVEKRPISAPAEQVANAVSGTVWDVTVKVNGEVEQVFKKRGEYVEKDEVLFTIDSAEAESALRKSELNWKNAREMLKTSRQNIVDNLENMQTNYDNVRKEYNRIRNLFDEGLVDQHQVDQVKDQLDQAERALRAVQDQLDAYDEQAAAAQIQLETAEIAVEDARRYLEYFTVKAPGSGILTDFNLEPGQTVAAAAGRVGQIQQADPIKLQTELTESNYQLVKGKKELVYYHPDHPEDKRTAPISYLAPIMSASTKTYTLELEIPNPDLAIQPGSRYMVQLTTEAEEHVLTIPVLSIIREESKTYVFVLEDGVYRKKEVKLGRVNGDYQEVLEGVKEGDQVVVSGQNNLTDGQQA
jgi:multidrug efflux pump subunit AcrA (membrane-fusion protein)